jgi:hypothetical protein
MSYLITLSVYMNKRKNNSRIMCRFPDILDDDSCMGGVLAIQLEFVN